MQLLNIKPKIHKYKDFNKFTKDFNINSSDLIFTHKFLYDEFMKPLNLSCELLFVEEYGSGEPSDEMIDKILAKISNKNYKRVFAIGGGTVIDIAKLLVLKDVKNTIDIFEKRIPIIKEKELIAIPTTCGTGSEVTNISIAEIKEKQTKLGIAVDELYPDIAVLIPELLKKLPYKYFVYSSIDALIHAIESYVSPKSNPYSKLFSSKAIEIILNGYKKIIDNGPEYRNEIIEDFLIASNYAGIAFGNTGVGAVHALSYPIGGKYHVPHGEANYLFFSEVFNTYNKICPHGSIKEVNDIICNILNIEIHENIYEKVDSFLSKLLPKKKLREYGMLESEIELFTDSVIEKQQRLLGNNYIPLDRNDILNIYKNLY